MKILLLSQSEVLADFLRNDGQILLQTMDKIDENFVLKEGIDFIVSYGYRYIVSGEILRHFPKRAVNLHISLLPYNKGADPNFWSFVEDTPKGVSIHYMDSGLDTGEIIAQKRSNLTFKMKRSRVVTTCYKQRYKGYLWMFGVI